MADKKCLAAIHNSILLAIKNSPQGISIQEVRQTIGATDSQEQLGRRLRELYPFYIIDRRRVGRKFNYFYVGPREEGQWEYASISKTIRAKILYRDGHRCQMCGRTPAEDQAKLHIDHKVPASWGGITDEDNLWTLCSACNEGKRAFFATFDNELMKKVMADKSVHGRIAALLHAKQGEWVDSELIEFVANSVTFQDDWHKRLRELRYFGLDIKSKRFKREKRSASQYRLNNWVDLPKDITKAARQYEKERAARNKKNLK